MFVKPKRGVSIIDMQMNDLLPAEGRAVDPSPYWERHILDGNVLVVDPPTDKEPAAPRAATPSKQEA